MNRTAANIRRPVRILKSNSPTFLGRRLDNSCPTASVTLSGHVNPHEAMAHIWGVLRRSLQSQSAIRAELLHPQPPWTRRARPPTFAWIGARTRRSLGAVEHPNQHDLRRAWRRAVESWLRCQRLIEVSINQQPVTPFAS